MAKTGPKRSFNPPARELAKLYKTMSLAKIAEHYGVGETVVWKRVKEHGISGNHRLTPKTFTPEHRVALSLVKRGRWSGDRNPNWKGGVRLQNLEARATGEYKQWRYAALVRAGFKCESCGKEQGSICKCCGDKLSLHVHHVQSFADHPELRFDPKNSEVLCSKCHWRSHDR